MAPENVTNDVTHRDLWVQLTEVRGAVDKIHALLIERKEDVERLRKDVDQLFTRQRLLESRLAQIAGIGLALAVLVPAAATLAPLVIDRSQPAEVRK